jgi:hypothetical protein
LSSPRETSSANIFGVIARDGFEQIEKFPGKNDIDPALDGIHEHDTNFDWNILPGDSTIKYSTSGRILLTENKTMERKNQVSTHYFSP